MSRKSEEFREGTRKLKKEIAETFGLDPADPAFGEQFDQYVKKVYEDRISGYTQKLIKKYPLELLQKSFTWAKENISPLELEETSFEEIMMRFIGENPSEVSVKDLTPFFDKSGEPRMISDVYDTPPRWPDAEAAQRGEMKEIEPPRKTRAQSPEMPSPQKLKGMSSKEIGDLIGKSGVSEE